AAATPAHYLRDLDDVVKSLHAPDPLDRWEAAEELGQHVNVRAIDPLLEAIRSGRNPLVRQRAMGSLAALLAALPARVVDYEVGARVGELRSRAESPEVHLTIAVLLDLGGHLEDAAPAYQRAFDPAAPDPVILRRWADLRRQRGQRYSSAVAARQLALWAESVARDHALAPGGEAPLAAARHLCAAADAARFAEQAILDAAKGGTEFPEDVADFQRTAAGARQLAEARLRDAEVALRTADARALTCDDARVTERLAAGQRDREKALRALRTERPKVARALLQLAAARDPCPALRQVAAAELGALR
ncbi:MAG TPA: HEAT repeat domain-containing protein, partial [Myxococcales bacterium]|nr:HEAT repeat domain-containing protein [Myxococcales bacterium]